jgi:DNA-binding beta-propeller fold protein YncE
LAIAGAMVAGTVAAEAHGVAKYRSPLDLKYSPDGKFLAVSDRTGGVVAIIDAAGGKVAREVALKGEPTGVAWHADATKVYVAERNAGTVAEVDAAKGKILRRLQVGLRPMGVAVVAKRGLLVVGNTVTNDVSIVDLANGKQVARIETPREPHFVAIAPDEKLAVVANLLPATNAGDPQSSACISLIDLESLKLAADVRLPGGSTCARQVTVSPDGKWAYVVHTVGRTTLPTTQLERGWVNTNAVSIIDLAGKAVQATLLLDRLSEGAADPWGLVLSKDGGTLWISLAGVHQVAKVDLAGVHLLLEGKPLPPLPEGVKTPRYIPDIWNEIKQDPAKRNGLVNDLAALYGAGLLARTPVDLRCPRGIDLAPDGKTLALAGYYSGTVALTDPATGKVTSTIRLGPDVKPDQVRIGEAIFHDALFCFQHWLSCATCHPEGARVDGFNWDLLNDGIGNPKNARSLVLSHKTAPVMALGVRASMEAAAIAGFRFIQFHEPTTEELEAVQAYLRSLQPEPSPYLTAKGDLTDRAKRGKKVFESKKAACATCHPAPLFTDMKKYDVGSQGPLDREEKEFVTTKLTELYRTAPYLHTGEAVTLEEVFTKFDEKGKHGGWKQLSKEEMGDLIEYLLSL